MLNRENIKNIFGLSPMQKNMIFSYAVNSPARAYMEQFDFHLTGTIDPDRLERALNMIVKKYDIFRTIFSFRKTDEAKQIVLKEASVNWTSLNVESPVEVNQFKEKDLENVFDISKEILVRGALLKTGETSYQFIFTFHHIIVDGWSLASILKELFLFYQQQKEDQLTGQELEEIPFSSYIDWLEGRNMKLAQSYWKDYLRGYDNYISLPDYSELSRGNTDNRSGYSRRTHEFIIPQEMTEQIKEIARDESVTANAVIQAAWGILLQKLNYVDDAVYGMIVSGRNNDLPGIDSIKGLIINAIPIRVRTEDGDSLISVCRKVHDNIFLSTAYEYYPLSDIQNLSVQKNNLINHVMAFENYPLSEELQNEEIKEDEDFHISKVDVHECSDYDFNIIIMPGNSFKVTFIYNELKFSEKTVVQISENYLRIFEALVENRNIQVKNICISTESDKIQQLSWIKQNKEENVVEGTLDVLFRNVAANLNSIALIHKGKQYTYGEIDRLSDAVQDRLEEAGVRANDIVGIFMPRCPEYVISVLGILKCGAVYVPIDLGNAPDRIELITSDSKIKTMCTVAYLSDAIVGDYQLLYIDADKNIDWNNSKFKGAGRNRETDVAYMMYTSGSTGRPKGCKVTHRNIVRLLFGQTYMKLDSSRIIMQIASPAFDISTFEIWGALLHGGTLVIPEKEDVIDGIRLKKLIEATKANGMVFTSSLFNRLIDMDPTIFAGVEDLLLGGEPLSVFHVRKVMEANQGLQVINAYGPTETTAFSTIYPVKESDLNGKRIPIGTAIKNTHTYIVDSGGNLLPVGAVGELAIGGDGVGAGYYNRDELTNAKFIPDCLLPGRTMYLTGDLARMLPDGTIDIMRRIDNQVKVRGYRIELGEIEYAMAGLPSINQVTVQIKELNGENHICAYYTSDGNPDIGKWRERLRSKLINYMIPAFYIKMNEIPVNVNGKVDKSMLPGPVSESVKVLTEIDDRIDGEMEVIQTVIKVYASVCGLDEISIDTNRNVFEMGVTSLNMITINNRLNKKLDRNIPLAKLFENNTISKMVNYIKHGEKPVQDTIDTKSIDKRNTDNMLHLLSRVRS